jgi:hypothetical protein
MEPFFMLFVIYHSIRYVTDWMERVSPTPPPPPRPPPRPHRTWKINPATAFQVTKIGVAVFGALMVYFIALNHQ